MRNSIVRLCTSWPARGFLLAVLAVPAHRLASARAWTALVGLLVLAALLLIALHHLALAQRRLRDAESRLVRRATELAALHAIGREIVASTQPERVFAVLERECRKLFAFDSCLIALLDRSTGEPYAAYRHRGRQSIELASDPNLEPLLAWIREEKRATRIDDLTRLPADSPLRGGWVAEGCRSVVLAPLLVEGEVIGALSLHDPQPSRYDDHQLELLTTVAQQAAIVLEGGRSREQARLDSLTGLHVRDYFFSRLAEEDERARRYGGSFAVLMADLDGFKEINDRNGHWAGDRCLREIGAVIRDQLRAADIACRYGGDEFCLLLPQTGPAGARAIAERIRSAVSRRIVGVEGLALRTTVSIGLAVFPDHHDGDLHGLMRKADEAMYRAKRAGRDRVIPAAAA